MTAEFELRFGDFSRNVQVLFFNEHSVYLGCLAYVPLDMCVKYWYHDCVNYYWQVLLLNYSR